MISPTQSLQFRCNAGILLLLLYLPLNSCQPVNDPEAVAKKHCSSCHLFPEPSLLDKKTWRESVLPEMAFRMGRDMTKLPAAHPNELDEILFSLPGSPLVSDTEWDAIQKYYSQQAPDSLRTIPAQTASLLKQFIPLPIQLSIGASTMITMLHADPQDNTLFVGTREGKVISIVLPTFIPEDSFQLPGPPSDLVHQADGSHLVSLMGIMDPNDQRRGSVVQLGSKSIQTLIDSIKRPVNIIQSDLNNDGQEDVVVSAFGNFTGALSVFERRNETYTEHVVHDFPGSRKSMVRDFNRDGLPDIIALITQGDERIALFTNRGNFRFSYQVLLKFPPVYGSSYFELIDFNADGYEDILYTNGDNADYSAILKPYHGIRIFLNDGANHFKESFFYPMYGCSMALAKDFDNDGDQDIAAISFFPDFRRHPEEGFLYLRNDGQNFVPYQTPLGGAGRWITMVAADIDLDNDTDLLLGALAFPAGVPEPLYQAWGQQKVSLLVLKNESSRD